MISGTPGAHRPFRFPVSMSSRYSIGLDYGTNSVRALIVNVANGAEVATAVWNYAHGTTGRDPVRATRTSRGSIRPTTSRARRSRSRRRSRPRKRSVRGLQAGPGHRHRRGHDRQHADAGGRSGPAARVPEAVRQEPGGDGLAVEGPHRRGRGRRDHRAGPRNAARSIWPSAAAPTRANGSSARFCTACAPRRRCSTPRTRGSNAPIGFPRCSPARSRPDKLTVGDLRRRPQGDVQRQPGAAIRTRSFSAELDPKLGELRSRLRRKRLRDRPGGRRADGAIGPSAPGCRRAFPVAVGAFDAHLGGVGSGHRAGHAGEDHRHQHLRHDGRADRQRRWRTSPACAASCRARILPGLLRPRGRPVGGGRHLQLVRRITSSPAGRQGGLARGADRGGGEAAAGRIGPAGAGLEQRQPHDPGGSAADRPAARPDALHDAGGDLPGADRGHGVRRADDHQPLRGIRRARSSRSSTAAASPRRIRWSCRSTPM